MRAPAHRLEAQTGGRPPGFVHVDLDGLWTLAGCYGYPEGVSFTQDPVFDQGLPRRSLKELFLPRTEVLLRYRAHEGQLSQAQLGLRCQKQGS